MATYDYKCMECGEIHEEVHGMMEDPQIECPHCKGSCKKHISSVNIDSYWEGATWEDTKFRK